MKELGKALTRKSHAPLACLPRKAENQGVRSQVASHHACFRTSASIAERIYSRNPTDGDPMAGVLVYTSAPDSEGTLGGLCALGEPDKLGRHIRRALEKVGLCASDPLCSEHPVGGGEKLHGASCHACSFLPETSCERGNKFLDRAALVPTVERTTLSFFRPEP